MNKLFFSVFCIFVILVFGLVGCGTDKSGEFNTIQEPKVSTESKQIEDFEVALKIEEDEGLAVTATITYLGEKDKIEIYHGGSIFFFNIYQKDGDFEHIGAMDLPLLMTTLTRKEPHKVEFTDVDLDELEPGTYQFEGIANFSLDKQNMVDFNIEIPVFSIFKVV